MTLTVNLLDAELVSWSCSVCVPAVSEHKKNVCVSLCSRANRELVEELHPLMKEALERRPEVKDTHAHVHALELYTISIQISEGLFNFQLVD